MRDNDFEKASLRAENLMLRDLLQRQTAGAHDYRTFRDMNRHLHPYQALIAWAQKKLEQKRRREAYGRRLANG